jgi:peptidoglycan/LPS O-acetylase OafA/YrhL
MPRKAYYTGLDLLRFLAACWVMSFHYFLGLSGALSWYRYGNLGVPVFFMISGFVISQSVKNSTLKKFFTGRFIRLFPLFWILCTLTYIFTLLMPNGNPVHLSEYLVSMTMLGDKFGAVFNLPRLVDPAYWSLSVELIFYAAIAFFVYFFKWKNIRYFLWGWIIVSCASFVLGIQDIFIMKTLLVRHASYFVFGATLALIVSADIKTKWQNWNDYILLVVVGTYSTVISYWSLPPYFVVNIYDGNIVAGLHIVFFMLVMGLVYLSKHLQSEKALIICGTIGGLTYPLYLTHQTIGNILIDYFKNYGTLAERGGIMMVLAVCLAYVIYVQDKKLRAYLKLKLQGQSSAPLHSSIQEKRMDAEAVQGKEDVF